MLNIRTALLQLATENPAIRATVLPMTRNAEKWQSMPKGWTNDSRKKFWETLTGDNKHKVTKCIKEMGKSDKGIDDPGAFCASLADRILGKEWRKKKARLGSLRFKRAADIRKALSQVFARHADHVKDFGKFLREVAGDIPEWVDKWSMDGQLALDKVVVQVGEHEYEGKQIGGYRGNQGFDPPEYDYTSFEVAKSIDCTVSATLNLRTFPKVFAKNYRSLIANPQGFMQATADLVNNQGAMSMLGKLLVSGMAYYLKTYDQVISEDLGDELKEAVEEKTDSDWTVEYDFEDTRARTRPKFKFDGKGIKVWAEGSVNAKVSDVDAPEPDFNEPDYDGPDDY